MMALCVVFLTAGFLKALSELLKLAGKVSALLLSLGAGLALSLELFLKFFNARLQRQKVSVSVLQIKAECRILEHPL